MSSDYSRPLLVAARASTHMAGLEDFLKRRVVAVSVDPTMPGALATARIVISMLQRLPSRVVIEVGSLSTEEATILLRTANEISSEKPALGLNNATSATNLKIQLGPRHREGWIRAVPDRYGAHVARGNGAITMPNVAYGIGCAVAAALAVGEVFKDLAEVLPSRRVDQNYLKFCPVTLGPDLESAPSTITAFDDEIAIVGLGAIGSAVALVLGSMSFRGHVQLVDRQQYARENKSTYALGTADDVARESWKTEVAASVLTEAEVARFDCSAADFVNAVDAGSTGWPRTVISALDSAEARYDIQRLWPDRLIDGATGDTMLGLHDIVAEEGPCIECFLPKGRSTETTIERLAKRTGLSISQLARGDQTLDFDDLRTLTEEQRTLLSPHVGKKICALANAIGLTAVEANGFQPSVPFVSMQAACLVVGRLLARRIGIAKGLPNFVQYDSLIGPAFATAETRQPVLTCYCQERATTIDSLRRNRDARSALHSSYLR